MKECKIKQESGAVNEEFDPPPLRGGDLPSFEHSPTSPPAPPLRAVRGGQPRFLNSPASVVSRKHFFPDAPRAQWDDWRWQPAHCIRVFRPLGVLLHSADDERKTLTTYRDPLRLSIPPYYASLVDRNDPTQVLRRAVLPVIAVEERGLI